jgi:two-component system, chemotaxis family, CheB/CheR fusion protein
MLFFARAEEARKSFDLRIFATDVAQHILPLARAGVYPASIAAEIGDDRLPRFFEPEDDTYIANKRLRESITFAPQNLLQDPPFSRLHLISCRNLLIYLESEVQRKVLALFHFALREHGHLFLGPPESVSGQEHLFQTVSKKWRIYRRIGPTRHEIVDFPLLGAHLGSAARDRPDAAAPRVTRHGLDPFQRSLLERFAPASVLIDRHFDAHVFHGPTGDYLQQPGGSRPPISLRSRAMACRRRCALRCKERSPRTGKSRAPVASSAAAASSPSKSRRVRWGAGATRTACW